MGIVGKETSKEFAFQHLVGTKLNFNTGMQRLRVAWMQLRCLLSSKC